MRLLNEKGCTDNDIFLPVAEAVYAVDKNADAAYSIGIQLSKKGDYKGALPYFEESVELVHRLPQARPELDEGRAGCQECWAGDQVYALCASSGQG